MNVPNYYDFPDFRDLKKRLDLDHNRELRDIIIDMYDKHYTRMKKIEGIPTENIYTLSRLLKLVREMEHKIEYGPDFSYEDAVFYLEKEPDKDGALQKLYDIYMKNCSEKFMSDIRNLFRDTK